MWTHHASKLMAVQSVTLVCLFLSVIYLFDLLVRSFARFIKLKFMSCHLLQMGRHPSGQTTEDDSLCLSCVKLVEWRR